MPEGFALAFDVDPGADFEPLRAFIGKLVTTRLAR
jgi:hypothetical protein